MSNIRLNGELRNQLVQLASRVAGDPSLVSMVMRWNENNSLVWTIDSLPNGQTEVPGGGAAHSEEVMIQRWTQFLVEAGDDPRIVEIILSKSPCLDRSPERSYKGTWWPRGCSSKLEALINVVEPSVQEWRIGFFNYYQEGIRIDAQAFGAVGSLAGIGKVDCYRLWDRQRL
jgi:hypothetical protein